MAYLQSWNYGNERFTSGMYTVAAYYNWLLLVMKSKFWTFECKYSHKTASIYSPTQEVEKCYIASVSKKPEQQHQAFTTYIKLLTNSPQTKLCSLSYSQKLLTKYFWIMNKFKKIKTSSWTTNKQKSLNFFKQIIQCELSDQV